MTSKTDHDSTATSPRVQRALVSVSDKRGLAEFARGLAAAGVELFSTGGTRRHLEEAGLAVRDVADYTGFPEMMDGRLKTLHPKVHGGILCRHDNRDDMAALEEHGIASFELVVVNLYPFEQTIAREGVSRAEAIEQIDIGGPTLVRAAAKNHAFVTLATDRAQYGEILDELQRDGHTSPQLRRRLAGEAFERTATYDRAIADYFARIAEEESSAGAKSPGAASPAPFPAALNIRLQRKSLLRYGENPHQQAALYAYSGATGAYSGATGANLVSARQLHGKELSYNNLLDLDSALAIARGLPTAGAVVIKHTNPCGAATAARLDEAARLAFEGDPQSAFGSVLGFNLPVDEATAEVLAEPGHFVEAIVAPEFTPEALQVLTTRPKWRANVRLVCVGPLDTPPDAQQVRQIDGGLLVQESDTLPDADEEWKVVTETHPDAAQQAALRFAWAVCRHVKSNAIVLCQGEALVGCGAGQMSRVDAVEIAIRKAGERSRGSVLASDAFFPFDDSIHQAAAAGVIAVIQPGGSRRDDEVIAACNQHGLPMIFTGERHFKH